MDTAKRENVDTTGIYVKILKMNTKDGVKTDVGCVILFIVPEEVEIV